MKIAIIGTGNLGSFIANALISALIQGIVTPFEEINQIKN